MHTRRAIPDAASLLTAFTSVMTSDIAGSAWVSAFEGRGAQAISHGAKRTAALVGRVVVEVERALVVVVGQATRQAAAAELIRALALAKADRIGRTCNGAAHIA